jgi:hypothetical protein
VAARKITGMMTMMLLLLMVVMVMKKKKMMTMMIMRMRVTMASVGRAGVSDLSQLQVGGLGEVGRRRPPGTRLQRACHHHHHRHRRPPLTRACNGP